MGAINKHQPTKQKNSSMKTKSNKFILTLLSMAAFGLTSAALQAQDTDAPAPDPVQQRQRLQWGTDVERPELSPELKEAVKQFRAQKNELLQAFRKDHAEERAAIHAMMLEYQGMEDGEAKDALLEEIKGLRDVHQDEVRALRQALRENARELRGEMRRARLGAPVDEG